MFVLNSDITIGNFRFSGVNDVHIKRSLHGIADTATITIPSIAKIITGGKAAPDDIITGKQFNDGDPVTIKLGYNGNLQTEFIGFVKHRNLNMPLTMECEGYSWLLRRNRVDRSWTTISVKDLLTVAVTGIDKAYTINIQCDIDCDLHGVDAKSSNGFDVVNSISRYSDGALSCFFIQPDKLWCGLLYTPYAVGNDALSIGTVSYRLGYNVIKENSLKERSTGDNPVQVKYNKKLADGTKISQASDVYVSYVATHNKILNHLTDAATLKRLANEKAYKLNYPGYEGNINAFLEPYATPGYVAYIMDDRYPERNGKYIIESTEMHFGISGARRTVEIGPQLGFSNT